LTKSIAHVGKIILDLTPKIYDTQRVMRIIGADGKPDLVTINEAKQNEQGVWEVLHDMTIGQYDVVMETGPGYNSKREAAVEAMMPLFTGNPALFQVAGDLMFRNMEFPGLKLLQTALPLPIHWPKLTRSLTFLLKSRCNWLRASNKFNNLLSKLQAMQLAIKQRQDIEQVKQDAETKRTLIKETNRAHDIELRNEERHADMKLRTDTQAHDTVLKTQTQMEIERMKADVAILLAQLDRESLRNASAETTERAI
jgi:hypothetical protein